jgi:hypothetical protein
VGGKFNPLFSNGGYEGNTCLRFVSYSGKTALVTHGMSTTAFGDNAMFERFLDSNVSKRQLEAADVPVVPPQVAKGTA